MKECSKCGEEVFDHVKTCGICGTSDFKKR